jgi:hypothetical protein
MSSLLRLDDAGGNEDEQLSALIINTVAFEQPVD